VEKNESSQGAGDLRSCDPSLSRKEFLKRAAVAALGTGAVFALPAIVDKFLVPPAYAIGSRASTPGSASDRPTGYGTDSTIVATTYDSSVM
jgi:hypothetical protein